MLTKLVGGGSILSKATRKGLKFIGICNTIKVIVCWYSVLACQSLKEIARTISKVYAAHALDKGIIVMTQTKNMKIWRFPPNIVTWEKKLFSWRLR